MIMQAIKYLKRIMVCLLLISSFSCNDKEMLQAEINIAGGTPVLLSLSYKEIHPQISVVTRANENFENVLSDLQIFIFDSEGNLKGYCLKEQGDLKQDGTKGDINIKTTTGISYIYAIANAQGGTYSVEGVPATITFDEDEAQEGNINFTFDDFRALYYQREEGEFRINDYFLMSGTVNEGKACIISKDENNNAFISDPIVDDAKLIKLRRVVSKVTFNIKAGENVKFEPEEYDLMNIPDKGSITRGDDATNVTYENFPSQIFTTQSRNNFTVYLPENIQSPQNSVEKWVDREKNMYTEDDTKIFINAPQNGTYVILRGTFTDEDNNRTADVEYSIHLGDFSLDNNNYNNERNYAYTYTIIVKGVDEIVAEAEKGKNDDYPAAEGIVIDYGGGKSYTLDSHYEYCVMRFNQQDIQTLISQNHGYMFQAEAFGKSSDIIEITNNTDINSSEFKAQLNGIDINWITFKKGGIYIANQARGGIGYNYSNIENDEDLLTAPELLKYLYSIANDNTQWENGTLTYTCYLNENYYEDMNWGDFVNIEPRRFYIANNVSAEGDGHSVYAKVAYSVSQYAIQTFYDRTNDGILVAYGCETTNDETGKNVTYETRGVDDMRDEWNGRTNMIENLTNLINKENSWDDLNLSLYGEEVTEAISMYKACMSRNRDLNRDGMINEEEIRWYVPTIQQYTGFWIGEPALATNARLYQNSTSNLPTKDARMHYYANSSNNVFWSEEGMAFGTTDGGGNPDPRYVRCIRNLKSNDKGYDAKPQKYYNYDPLTKTFNLEGLVNPQNALRTNVISYDLPSHHERDGVNSLIRIKFKVASTNVEGGYGYQNVEYNTDYTKSPCYKYNGRDGRGWRIPNQREFCLMALENDNLSLTPYTLCRTHFSNSSYRTTYIWGNGNLMMETWDEERIGYVRCVRDVVE